MTVVRETATATGSDTVGRALNATAKRLADAGIESARLDARLLVGAAVGETAAGVIARPERALSASQARALAATVARRCAREPMAHILGAREFWSLDFEVSPSVLTPRSDSETVIEAACDHLAPSGEPIRVVDLGTGSGCLLIALLHEYGAATGIGVDIDPAAVALARRNAERLGVADRAMFLAGSWTAPLSGRFDLVVSNPPYIASGAIADLAPEVSLFEPRLALDGGSDGLAAYRALLPLAREILAPKGYLLLEIGAGQGAPIRCLAQACGLETVDIRADMAAVPRVAILRHACTSF